MQRRSRIGSHCAVDEKPVQRIERPFRNFNWKMGVVGASPLVRRTVTAALRAHDGDAQTAPAQPRDRCTARKRQRVAQYRLSPTINLVECRAELRATASGFDEPNREPIANRDTTFDDASFGRNDDRRQRRERDADHGQMRLG